MTHWVVCVNVLLDRLRNVRSYHRQVGRCGVLSIWHCCDRDTVLTGVHIGNDVIQGLEEDSLVHRVRQPRVCQSFRVERSVNADATPGCDTLRSGSSSAMIFKNREM